MTSEELKTGKIFDPERILTQYNTVGAAYSASRDAKDATGVLSPAATFIRKRLGDPRGRTLVDVGCGGGQDLMAYRGLGFADVRGMESAPGMAQIAREHVGGSVVIDDGTWSHLPYADASKDVLVGRSSIHYEHVIDAAYREAARVLKPGGTLILVVPHPEKEKNRKIEVDGGREYVHDIIRSGTVPIVYPRHFENEYFSPTFNELFELREKEEFQKERNGKLELDQLAFIATRK